MKVPKYKVGQYVRRNPKWWPDSKYKRWNYGRIVAIEESFDNHDRPQIGYRFKAMYERGKPAIYLEQELVPWER